MEINWQESNWQNSHLNSRQAIVFVLSTVLIFLILLIPLKLKTAWPNQNPQLTVSIIKPTLKTENTENNIIETSKPISTPIKEEKKVVNKQVSKQIKDVVPVRKIIAIKPIPTISKVELPSAGTILNSINSKKTLTEVSQEFKQFSEQENDFIPKIWVKQKEKELVANQNQMKQIVKTKVPLALKTLRTAVGFLITPVEGRVKTQDSLNYCHTLGRRSVFCPNGNPLID